MNVLVNFFIRDGIIYDTTDVCNKQYRSANEVWLLYILEVSYRVITDRQINSPGYCGRKIDVINGSDKTYLRKKIA